MAGEKGLRSAEKGQRGHVTKSWQKSSFNRNADSVLFLVGRFIWAMGAHYDELSLMLRTSKRTSGDDTRGRVGQGIHPVTVGTQEQLDCVRPKQLGNSLMGPVGKEHT